LLYENFDLHEYCIKVNKIHTLVFFMIHFYDLQRTNVFVSKVNNLVEKKFHVAVGRDRKLLFLNQYAPANSIVQQNPIKRRNFQ